LGAPDALALVDGSDGGDLRYGINTTDYVELPTARLAEYSLVKGRTRPCGLAEWPKRTIGRPAASRIVA